MKLHAEFGASSCDRGTECPGWIQLAKDAPPSPPSRFAAEGTVAHAVAAAMLAGEEINTDAVYDADGFTFELDEEMLNCAELYTAYVKSRAGKFFPWVKVETRVEIPHTEIELFGTADCIITLPYDRIIAVDYKYGQGVAVDVKENRQALYYALGALLAMDEDDAAEIDTIECAIFQPRLAWKDSGNIVKTWECSKEWLLNTWRPKLMEAADRIAAGDMSRKAGDWCRFCPARGICPEKREQAQNIVQMDFASVPALLPVPAALDAEMFLRILQDGDRVIDYIEGVKQHAFNVLAAGRDLPNSSSVYQKLAENYVMVPKRGHRKFTDKEAATKVFENLLGDKAFKRTLHTPKQIEDALKKAGILTMKFEQLVMTPDIGSSMEPRDSTKARNAIKKDIANDFKDVV